MSEQIMITLNQIEKDYLGTRAWDNIVETNGGAKADFDKPLPLSNILASNGLNDTIWCFKYLPENMKTFMKFALFCTKEANTYTDNKPMHTCISTIENYLEGTANLKELRAVSETSYKKCMDNTNYSYDSYANRAVVYTLYLVYDISHMDITSIDEDTLYNITCDIKAAIYTAYMAIYKAACSDVYKVKDQERIDYLRMLLDGEID